MRLGCWKEPNHMDPLDKGKVSKRCYTIHGKPLNKCKVTDDMCILDNRWEKNVYLDTLVRMIWDSQVALLVKNPLANAGDLRDQGSIPGSGRFPWRRNWQPTPVFFLGESHGPEGPGGPWGCRVGHGWSNLRCICVYIRAQREIMVNCTKLC